MKKHFQIIVAFFLLLSNANCSTERSIPESTPIITVTQTQGKTYTYLTLGDSYTIGQSVCETCRFPAQLSKKLADFNPINTYSHKIIAQTGWTTTNLLSAIATQNPTSNYDLANLLIGVNNQYQNKSFTL